MFQLQYFSFKDMVPILKNLTTRGFAIALTKLSSRLVASSATMYRVHFTTAPEKRSLLLGLGSYIRKRVV